jgi:exonuclease SbcC
MQILSIHLKNIKSHRDTEISFSAGINVLSGPNGAGKSTIFEAIGYALFGVDARDFVSNIDRFLSIGSKKGEISVVFRADDGETYRVSRTVGAAAKWLLAKEIGGSFEVEDHARLEETEARVTEILGLANGRPLAEQFKLVIGPFQNDFLGPFVIKQPTKRQEAFDEILGIDAWRKTYKGTAGLLSAVQEHVKVLTAEVNVLKEQLAILPQKDEELNSITIGLEQKRNELIEKDAELKKVELILVDLDMREKCITGFAGEIQIIEDRIKSGNERIADKIKEVEAAQKAKVIVDQSRSGKESYEKAEVRLTELRVREQQRKAVEKEIVTLDKQAQSLTQSVEHEQTEISKVDTMLSEEEAGHVETRKTLQPNEAMLKVAALLPELRITLERLKGEHSLLAGRRVGFEDGQEKLAEGMCPFFQDHCLNIADHNPQELFARKIEDLDHSQAALDKQIIELTRQVAASEKTEKELAGIKIRLQELDKQVVAIAEKRNKNHERATKLDKLREQQVIAIAKVA